MRNILFASAFMLICLSGKAQIFQTKDLSSSLGSWEGKLTYLDYSTGKPFTMSANIKISLTENKSGYIMGYEYPKEPQQIQRILLILKTNYLEETKL